MPPKNLLLVSAKDQNPPWLKAGSPQKSLLFQIRVDKTIKRPWLALRGGTGIINRSPTLRKCSRARTGGTTPFYYLPSLWGGSTELQIYVFQLRSIQRMSRPWSHGPWKYPMPLSGTWPLLAPQLPYGLLKESWLIGLDKAAKPMRCEWALG